MQIFTLNALTLVHGIISVIDENEQHYTNAVDWKCVFHSCNRVVCECYGMPHVRKLLVVQIFALHNIHACHNIMVTEFMSYFIKATTEYFT